MYPIPVHRTFLKKQLLIAVFLLLFATAGMSQSVHYIIDLRDNQRYITTHIDELWWMARNLNFGTRIDNHFLQENNGIIEKYCPFNLESNCAIYGGLYQWDELMQYGNGELNQGICPSGWHVSTDDEWEHLEKYLGMQQASIDSIGYYRGYDEGGMLKSRGTGYWYPPNMLASDVVNFKALPAGYIDTLGGSWYLRSGAFFWLADTYEGKAMFRNLWYDNGKIGKSIDDKRFGASVRCVKDSPYMFARDSFTDPRDGRKYATVLVENHWWMAENLNAGEQIDHNVQQSDNGIIQKYCYNDDIAQCNEYGGLYSWNETMNYTAGDLQGICPDGWHIPTDENWMELEWALDFFESDLDYQDWRGMHGDFLQEKGGSGFEALMSGNVQWNGTFKDLDQYAYYWTSTEDNANTALIRELQKGETKIGRICCQNKTNGYSVRCVRDENEKISLTLDAEKNNVCPGQEITLTAKTSGGSDEKYFKWWSSHGDFSSEDSVVVVAPEVTTTYIARIVDGYIYIRDSITVNVIPTPVFMIAGDTSVCPADEQHQYSVPNISSYTYSWGETDGNLISYDENHAIISWGTTPGYKYINVTATDNLTGCSTEKTLWVHVLESPKPDIILKGQSLLLICTDSGQVYQWYRNEDAIKNATKQFYYDRNNKSGDYTVEITWDNQCRNFSEPISYAKKSTGDAGESEPENVFIRPNPTNGNVILEMISDYTGPVNIAVTSITGKTVKLFQVNKDQAIFSTGIELDQLPEGSYLMTVDCGGTRDVHRITIKR
jgi:uncharacterized protein (TIGR02145 family)